MPVLIPAGATAPPRAFAVWRVVVWLLLLLAAFGCAQYVRHAHLVWLQAEALPPGSRAAARALHAMLLWDAAYLVVALALVVLCVACILRQAWARAPLRIAAILLMAWVLVTGVMLFVESAAFDRSSAEALAQVQTDPVLHAAILHARRSYHLGLAFKAVAVPLLFWLAWSLGRPAVRAQFRLHG